MSKELGELKYLENMVNTYLVEYKNKLEFNKANNYDCELLEEEIKHFESCKQALIKAQEPKHYLKWEDLYFNDDEQRMKVSLNGSIHHLCYYRSIFGYVCIIDNTDIIIREENKNFFNDLHLERV